MQITVALCTCDRAFLIYMHLPLLLFFYILQRAADIFFVFVCLNCFPHKSPQTLLLISKYHCIRYQYPYWQYGSNSCTETLITSPFETIFNKPSMSWPLIFNHKIVAGQPLSRVSWNGYGVSALTTSTYIFASNEPVFHNQKTPELYSSILDSTMKRVCQLNFV